MEMSDCFHTLVIVGSNAVAYIYIILTLCLICSFGSRQKQTVVRMMTPLTDHLASQPDEASILSAMFAKPLLANCEPAYHEKKLNPSSHVAMQSYDIDHSSAYAADTLSDDQAQLLPSEISYCVHGYGFDGRLKSKTLIHEMPTIWQCVKNAFTMTTL
jgi:hypothetical protein